MPENEPPAELPEGAPESVVDLETLEQGRWFDKIQFAWRREDDAILSKIQIAADEMAADIFAEARREIDIFYAVIRVPKLRNGIVVLDAKNRIVWETIEGTDKPVEDWDQLTGQDIETAIMNLSRMKMDIALEVNKLKNQAMYGKMAADDTKDDNWGKTMSGTQGDKQARVNRESRADRYHSYFRYYLWTVADVIQREIVDFLFRLKDLRNWRINAQQR
jgi:hypothetical protein